MRPDDDAVPTGLGVGRVLGIVVPDFVRKRFTLKFALVVLLMGLTVGVIGQTATDMVSAQIQENVEEEYQDLAAQQADLVKNWIQRNTIAVKLTSKSSVLDDRGGGAKFGMRWELATAAANLDDVQTIYLVNQTDAQTRVVSSPQLPYGYVFEGTSREWLAETDLSGLSDVDVRITDVHRVDGQYVVAFISPIETTENRYLVVEHNVDQITATLQGGGESSQFTQIVDGSGTIQMAGNESRILTPYGNGTAARSLEAAEDLADSPARAGVIASAPPNENVLEEPYTVGYAPIRSEQTDLDWTLVVHEPTHSAFGFVETISRWGKIMTFGGILLVGLLSAGIGYTTTRDLNRLRRLAQEMQAGNLDVTVRSNRIDAIGQLYDGFDNMRASLKAQIEEARQARKAAEVSRAEAMRMNEYLQEKAEEYGTIMDKCASGDLTQRMEPDGENEGMDRIATEFNDMIAELEQTTGRLKAFAAEVEDTGLEVQSSSDSVRIASEHVADSVQTISDDAYDQKERLQTISREIDELVDLLDEYAIANEELHIDEPLSRLNEVAEQVRAVAQLSEETLAESHIVAGAAEEQSAELTEVSQRAADLARFARPLREVLDGFETDVEDVDLAESDAALDDTRLR